MDYKGYPRSAPGSRSDSIEMERTSRSASSTPPPLVPVAAAPKDQTLYESLLRYHNENDSVSTDDSGARRRRNPKVFPAGLKAGDEDDDDDTTTEDRKMPAKPIPLKTPPPIYAPPPTNTSAAAVTSNMSTPKTQPSSRTSMINRKTFAPSDYVSPQDAPKPGIVHVSEPAIRPDSAMYIAAYGPHSSVSAAVPSPPPPTNGPSHGQPKYPDPMGSLEHTRDGYMREAPQVGLSHSTHGLRTIDYGRMPEQVTRHNSGPPDQLLQQTGGRPPDYMMNIGNDDHIGLPHQKAPKRNSKSPLRNIFGGKRNGGMDKDVVDTPTGGSPATWYAKHFPGTGDRPSTSTISTERPTTRSSIAVTTHSAPPTFSTARATAPQVQSLGYPVPTTLMRASHDDNHSVTTTESSMDEELRLALEISKQDTGNPPRTAPRPIPKTQDNFRREAMSQARHASNNSLADLLLALKLSAEESGLDRRASTSLDELLAFEMSQDSRQHMTDFVAAGITTSSSASTTSTNNTPNTYKPSTTPMKHKTSSIPTTGGNNNNPEEQFRILEKIREEQEQRQLEIALKASERERASKTAMNHPPLTHNNNYLQSQQRAMEDWIRPGGSAMVNQVRQTHQRQNSMSSIDSEGRRQQLLERGTSETKQAIRSGQAHVVICLGCGGRLQAPLSYSLVYCPKCHTISPA